MNPLLLIIPLCAFAFVTTIMVIYTRGRDNAKGYKIERKQINPNDK